MAPIAEVREADADAITAEIYADIRQSSALPQVNLIYRHLATMPGVLSAVWASVRPWVRSTNADEAVADLLAVRPTIDGNTPIYLTEVDQAVVLALLSVYRRGNIINLLALSAVRARATNPRLPTSSPPSSRSTSPPTSSIPPLPRMDELPVTTANLVGELTKLHNASQFGVIPSLYLHLANWPGILPFVKDRIETYVRQGGLATDRASIIETATAYGIAAAPLALTEFPAETKNQAIAAIELFTTSVIPDLLAVGRVLMTSIPVANGQFCSPRP